MMGSPIKRIALVACVSSQSDSPAPASELFQGEWFSLCRQYGMQCSEEWYILSAKYGLIAPEVVIEPYSDTIRGMNTPARRQWAHRVSLNLPAVVPKNAYVTLLAGSRVRDVIVPQLEKLGCEVNLPLSGLNPAQQLRRLKELCRS